MYYYTSSLKTVFTDAKTISRKIDKIKCWDDNLITKWLQSGAFVCRGGQTHWNNFLDTKTWRDELLDDLKIIWTNWLHDDTLNMNNKIYDINKQHGHTLARDMIMAGKNVFDFDNVAFDQHTHLLIRTFLESFQSDRFQMLYLRPRCPQYYRPNIFVPDFKFCTPWILELVCCYVHHQMTSVSLSVLTLILIFSHSVLCMLYYCSS